MNLPVTTLDRRYSDPVAVAVGWEETCRILQDAELFWLATVRADGRPHVTPVVAVWVDGAICFTTGAEEQKFLNLRSNQHVVLTAGCSSWDKGIDVVVEGKAAHVTDHGELGSLAAAFATKWDGRWQFAVGGGGFRDAGSNDGPSQVQVFSVTPAKVFAHAKGDPFGATTHKF
jgi:uncharacterized pyridoxamine 5'-phosphate oxidase family protein